MPVIRKRATAYRLRVIATSHTSPEFVAYAIKEWLETAKIKSICIEPGTPWENGHIESFHDKFRDEYLNQELFHTLAEAHVMEGWRIEYNEDRTHSAIDRRRESLLMRLYNSKGKLARKRREFDENQRVFMIDNARKALTNACERLELPPLLIPGAVGLLVELVAGNPAIADPSHGAFEAGVVVRPSDREKNRPHALDPMFLSRRSRQTASVSDRSPKSDHISREKRLSVPKSRQGS